MWIPVSSLAAIVLPQWAVLLNCDPNVWQMPLRKRINLRSYLYSIHQNIAGLRKLSQEVRQACDPTYVGEQTEAGELGPCHLMSKCRIFSPGR